MRCSHYPTLNSLLSALCVCGALLLAPAPQETPVLALALSDGGASAIDLPSLALLAFGCILGIGLGARGLGRGKTRVRLRKLL